MNTNACNDPVHLQCGKHACNVCTPPNKGPITAKQRSLLFAMSGATTQRVHHSDRLTLASLVRRKLVEGSDRYGWKVTAAGMEVLEAQRAPMAPAKPTYEQLEAALGRAIKTIEDLRKLAIDTPPDQDDHQVIQPDVIEITTRALDELVVRS
jgi:hypothetical protein